MQLFINLWSKGHGKDVLPDLIRAILQDEPIKMRRIGKVFHVDVGSIHNMWIVNPCMEFSDEVQRDQVERKVLQEVGKDLSFLCNTVIADVYNKSVVVFMDDPQSKHDLYQAGKDLITRLLQEGITASLTLCYNLYNTTQVREAYLNNQNYIEIARLIFPGKSVFTVFDIQFSQSCMSIINKGENKVKEQLALLDCLKTEERLTQHELFHTLTVYLLDTGLNVSKTAEILFLHKNTIKYRLNRISEMLGFSINEAPTNIPLYTACALRRLIHAIKQSS